MPKPHIMKAQRHCPPPHPAAPNTTRKLTCKQICPCFWHGMTNKTYATVRIHFANYFCNVTAQSFWQRYSASDIFWIFIKCFPYFFRKIFIVFFINFEFWNAWSWCNYCVFDVAFIFFHETMQPSLVLWPVSLKATVFWLLAQQ